MDRIYLFLIRNDVWIYIVSAFGLFWYLAELWRANRSLRTAVFGLEKERGTRMRNNALIFVALFTTIIAIVYFVNSRIAPTLPPELLRPPTPTPDIFSTRLSSPTPLQSAGSTREVVTPAFAATATLSGANPAASNESQAGEETPTVTATAYIPPTPFVDCTADLMISEPRNGAAISGELFLSGTADTENFQYYILETNGPQTNGQWASLLGRQIDQPVREGFLGTSNLTMWEPGPYLIRLTTFDIADNITGQCVIQVTLTGNS
jgi:hypothetical protein